jgi:hypothetical protein
MTPELERDIELGGSQQTEGSKQTEGSQQTEGSGHCAFITPLICIIFAVICIVAPLQYNTASGNEILVLEGPIIIVFCLGVAVISCVLMCASVMACGEVCNVCCIAL